MLAADFLEANFDKVFSNYQKLLHSDNYVTRRQSLKLLGELLLDRHNFSVSLNGMFNISIGCPFSLIFAPLLEGEKGKRRFITHLLPFPFFR